ncbi:MAG: glycosyltransferase [Acidobacteriota bacterium]
MRFHSSSTPQTGPGRHGQNVRLGLLLTESDIPSEQDRQLFFQQFGRQHSFLHRSSQNRFHVFSSTVSEKLAFDSLPVDYFYAPNDWKHRITDDQIRNILLCLNHSRNDFLIISGSLSQFPLAAVSSIRNHTIFSKELGLEFPEGQAGREATGKILRLLPYNHAVTQMNVEEIFREHSVTWTPDPCWPPREPLLRMEVGQIRPILPVTVSISKLNPRVICKEEAPALPATEFIPRFHKQKPLVFVWPMLWVVGGAERNAIEAMRHLKDRYHFVVITMERPHQSQGSLHHQLKDIAEAVYDLGELAPYENYLDMLSDLKQTYQPDLIWTANGSPWFSDNAMEIRELFREVPVVDQQVYDTTRGWILRYREPGVQSFDRFVAINKKIQETFTERFRIDPDRVDLIYHAVNTYRFDPSHYSETDRREYFKKFDLDERRKIFVFAGRLTGQKRPIDFLQLVLKRQQAGDDALFAMVGDGDLTPVVDEFIRQHDLKNLRRIPFVENMAEVFSIASGLILTSEFEGMPIVILEALCMGVPVLATDVGDVKLMLDEYQAGVVIPGIGDVDSIDQNYEAWVANLDNYRENSQANAALVRKRFSGETVAKQYAESWERARQENNQPTRPPSNGVSNLVSIIIPSYNHARFIKTTIDSVLTQSYDRIELIVIDDGSTDDSVKYLREITDPRYSFYCQENQGAHVAINRGLGLASGEYLAILNSDDAFHPDRIKELMAEFRDDPEVELLSTWIEVVDTNGQQLAIKEGWHNLEPWPIAHPELSFQQTDDFGLNLLRGNFVASTSNILMRRSFYNKIGGMRNLHFAHDWDFLMRAAAGGKCKLVPKPLLKYRVHESNTTNSNRAWMLFDICWVLAANLHRFEDSKLFNPSSPQKSMQNLITLYESINLQGNDKVFWAMRAFIQSLRSKGVANPEELLLEDDEFREKFMGYITV